MLSISHKILTQESPIALARKLTAKSRDEALRSSKQSQTSPIGYLPMNGTLRTSSVDFVFQIGINPLDDNYSLPQQKTIANNVNVSDSGMLIFHTLDFGLLILAVIYLFFCFQFAI